MREEAEVGAIEAAAVHAIRQGIEERARTVLAKELEEILALRSRLRDRLEDLRREGEEGLRKVEGERKVRRAYAAADPTEKP